LAFVPALIHRIGAWYPLDGIGQFPRVLAQIAQQAGVDFRYKCPIAAIRCEGGTARGIVTQQGESIPADAVLVGAHGVGAYLELVKGESHLVPRRTQSNLEKLPLQSPGICAYLAIRGATPCPYLRSYLPGGGALCRLLVMPSALPIHGRREAQEWRPARLMAPMDHHAAETGGLPAQQEYLHRILDEDWWRDQISEYRVLATRLPHDWGSEFRLYRDSMNPVMTARFMRAGRLAHRSPYVKRLYLAGSSTHPGQWVSFCAISGILAADCLRQDLGQC
jgi:phytoene dehydrogenase-like protein